MCVRLRVPLDREVLTLYLHARAHVPACTHTQRTAGCAGKQLRGSPWIEAKAGISQQGAIVPGEFSGAYFSLVFNRFHFDSIFLPLGNSWPSTERAPRWSLSQLLTSPSLGLLLSCSMAAAVFSDQIMGFPCTFPLLLSFYRIFPLLILFFSLEKDFPALFLYHSSYRGFSPVTLLNY